MVDDVITDLEIAVLCDLLDGPSVNLKAHRRSVLNMADVPRSWPRRGEAPGSVRRGKNSLPGRHCIPVGTAFCRSFSGKLIHSGMISHSAS